MFSDLDRLLAANFREELLDSISCLQSQVQAIRMSRAIEHGLGPLDGLAKDVETMSRRYTANEAVIQSESHMEPISKDTTKLSQGMGLLHSRAITSLALPPVQPEEYGIVPKLDLSPRSGSPLRLVARRMAFESFPLSPIRYEHMKIDPENNIRLLILCRGTGDDRLECSMTVVPSINHQLKYTAISHAWGSELTGCDIWVRNTRPLRGIRNFRNVVRHVMKYKGFLTAYRFPIRRNIYSALRHLRKEDQDLFLWVDVLCIDRHDVHELNMQVEHIADIFQGAKEVSIWLGEGNKHSDTAFSFIQENKDPIKDLSVEQRGTLEELLRNQWFRRLWIVQELALAKRALLYCGNKTMEWVEFSAYVERIYSEHTRLSELLGPLWEDRLYQSDSIYRLAASPASLFVRVVKNVFEKSKDGEILDARLSLEYLVYTLSRLEVSDSRDAIYALLSIAKDTRKALDVSSQKETEGPSQSLRPNYRKDYLEVCSDFTRFCIQSSGSLDVICRHWAHKTDIDLPSWIPRLREAPFGDSKEFEGRVHSESLVGIPGHRIYNASWGARPEIGFGAEIGEPQQPKENLERIFRISVAVDSIRLPGGIASLRPAQLWPRRRLRHLTDLDVSLSMSFREKFLRYICVVGIDIDLIMGISPRVTAGVIPEECFMLAGLQSSGERAVGDLNKVAGNLWRILVADRDPNGRRPPSWYHQACSEALSNINGNGDLDTNAVVAKSKSPLMTRYLQRVRDVTWNRRLIRTKQGRLGLVPAGAEPSDLVCVLFGCSVPVVLRAATELPTGSFRLIGECYIYGVMEGEAMRDFDTYSRSQHFVVC